MISKINAFCSEKADQIFTSIWTAYGFFTFSLIPLAASALMAPILYMSNCVQLVALPLLGVSNSVQSAATRKLLQETHDTLMAELEAHKQEHDETQKKLDELMSLITKTTKG